MSGDASWTGASGADSGGASRVDARALLLDQAFDPGTLRALRADLQIHARQAGLTEDRAGDLVLAVHELAANTIAHGAGHGHLRLWREPGALCCEITDDGSAAQPGLPAQPGAPAVSGPQTLPGQSAPADPARLSAADPAGTVSASAAWPIQPGHGLWLARQVAARLELWSDDHGSRVVIMFQLPPEA
jgi:two-component sensor histidine kinase